MKHPAAAVFDKLQSEKAILLKAAVKGRRLEGLHLLAIPAAKKQIGAELRRVFVADGEAARVLLQLIAEAAGHALVAYPDVRTYLYRLYHFESLASDVDPGRLLILTGPAGTGKTEVVRAVKRVLSDLAGSMNFPGHKEFELQPVHVVQARTLNTANEIFVAIGNGLDVVGGALEAAGRLRYRLGTSITLVDELQFLTQSASANASIAKVLLGLHALPILTVAVCNYSLLHRVMKRPVEERQRFLARPIVLLPDSAKSSAWRALLAEYQEVLYDVLEVELAEIADDLWIKAAGGKRVLVELLIESYSQARSKGRTKIVAGDVRAAYLSLGFHVNRTDVEAQLDYWQQGRSISRRQDLICPLPDEVARSCEARAVAKAAHDAALAAVVRRRELNSDERYALDGMSDPTDQLPPIGKRKMHQKTATELQDVGIDIMRKVLRS